MMIFVKVYNSNQNIENKKYPVQGIVGKLFFTVNYVIRIHTFIIQKTDYIYWLTENKPNT